MANYNYPYVPNYSGIPTPTYPSNGTSFTQPQYNQYQQSYQTMPSYAPYQNSYANAVNNKNIIWVAGQAGAEAYQLEPGSRAVLLDSKDQVFYIKVVGMDGRPEPLMAFKYEPLNLNIQNESSQAAPIQDMSNYVTKDDFNELKRMLDELTSKRNSQQNQKGNHNG